MVEPEYETATGARLDEIAAERGVRARLCFREDYGDGFGAIWEPDSALRGRIRAKLGWEMLARRPRSDDPEFRHLLGMDSVETERAIARLVELGLVEAV
jgi:hypothetical protein